MDFRWLFMVIRLCTATSLDGWTVRGVLAWVSAPGNDVATPLRPTDPPDFTIGALWRGSRRDSSVFAAG
jgi:hypothetical protein